MKILVTGGRNYRDRAALHAALSMLDRGRGIHAMAHGGAGGADTLAGWWAKEWGVTVEVFPADWARLGPSAGPKRNQQMLDQWKPDLVVAFPGGKGTADMVRRAETAGVPIHFVE